MSFDLFFKHSPRNWARKETTSPHSPQSLAFIPGIHPAPGVTSSPTSPVGPSPAGLTPEAKAKIVEIQAIQKAAEGGDRKAQKKWRRIGRKINKVRKAAAKGNPQAIQALSLSDLPA